MDAFLHDLTWVLPLRSDVATHIANAFTLMGYGGFFIAMLPIGYWLIDKEAFTRLALLVILVGVSNGLLKDIFDDPRPDRQFSLDGRVGDSYGLPSGHAQVGAAMWLWVAYELRRAWFWPIALLIAFGVAFSRLYLGVHDVEDVLVGFGLGIACVLLFRWFLSPHFAGWRALHPAIQIAAILAFEAILFLAWPEPGGPGVKFAVGGMLVGWWSGVLLEQRTIHYRRHPNWAVALVGAAAGIGLIFGGLVQIAEVLVAQGGNEVAAAWVQSFVLAFFVTAVAPYLFIKTRTGVREAAP